MSKISSVSSASSRHSGYSYSRTLTSTSDTWSDIVPENLSLEELTALVESLQQVVKQLDVENHIFQSYLEYREPSLISDMDETLEAMAEVIRGLEPHRSPQEDHPDFDQNLGLHEKQSFEEDGDESFEEKTVSLKEEPKYPAAIDVPEKLIPYEEENGMIIVKHIIPSDLAKMVNVPSTLSIRPNRSIMVGSFVAERVSSLIKRRVAATFERCPRMNFAQRLDISKWATDQQQLRLKAAIDRGNSIGGSLRARTEAMIYRITETRNMMIHFNAKYNPAKMKGAGLPAETFIKDIRANVQFLDAIIERLRLKMGQLRPHSYKLKADLAAKRELSGSLRPVDIETLKIENEELTRNIALKSKYLNDVKTVSGLATQKVISHKKRLLELSNKLKSLKNDVHGKIEYIAEMEHEEKPVVKEAQKAERALTNIRVRVGKFTAPDVMEYVRQKRDIKTLRKNISYLKRTYALKSQTASELLGRMKYLQQRKSGDYTRMSLKLSSLLRSEFKNRRPMSYLPEQNPILDACLEKVPKCNEPLNCPSQPT